MRIYATVNSEYGRRKVRNIQENKPSHWTIESYELPSLPPVIDEAEPFLPKSSAEADLLLSLGDNPGVQELIPDFVKLTFAKAVIAPIDNRLWLPEGLKNQLIRQLDQMGVAYSFPLPFCKFEGGSHPLIAEFGKYFGKPLVEIKVENDEIKEVKVIRDAPCGCARFTAKQLIGCHVDKAEEMGGLHHHHYPCLASMGIDPAFDDTLMHVSGNMMKIAISQCIEPYKKGNVTYLTDGK